MNFYAELQRATETERARLLTTPIIAAAMAGRVSRSEYLAFLTRAYHHVKHTAPLLMAAGARVPESMEWLRVALAHYIQEEIGHHEWILDDIAAAGGDAAAVRAGVPDADTELMVAYAYDVVQRRNPVGLFGMVLVLEGTSVQLACQVAARLADSLDLPATAFTYLNSHGTLDIEHMGHFEKVVNRFESAEDRQWVIHCARMFFRLYGNVLNGVRGVAL